MDYNIEYYKNLSKLVDDFDNFSVIGHLDLIKRYDKEGILDDSLVIEYIEDILKKLIKNNKGIEVNTSSIRYKINDLMPSRNILKLYKSLGGEIITIGSDSHSIEHLAEGFDEIITELKEIGFNKLCTFDKMKPKFYDI